MAVILLIEDDADIRVALRRGLAGRGHEVRTCERGIDSLPSVLDDALGTVLLDLGLPDIDGLDLLRMIRAVSEVPIIVCTARDDEGHIIRALDLGADDFVTKPFSAAQIDARIRAVGRRGAGLDRPVLTVGGLVVDLRTRRAEVDGRPIDLRPREFELLAFLMGRAGEYVTKRELLGEVWRLPNGAGDKTVDVHVSWLRRRLGETVNEPRYLHTRRGAGVKVEAPVDLAESDR
jgi:two-component system, OmpR family, KDP operon response regulator KdpE